MYEYVLYEFIYKPWDSQLLVLVRNRYSSNKAALLSVSTYD